jgi:hypothetical protein
MRQIVFLAAASLVCVLSVSAQQHNIDTQKSTLTIHVGKTGAFSGLGHEHEVRAPIHSGTADTGSHPAVEIHVNARELRVIDKDESNKDRAEVQKTMLGPEVLDSEGHQEIVFKSTGAESAMGLMAVACILWGHYHDVELQRVGIRLSTFVLILAALSIALSKKRA